MPYTSRCTDTTLTPEERDVAEALRDYTTREATRGDWLPARTLYQVYRDWFARHRWRFDPDAPDRLTIRQFGRAVGRVLPDVKRCKRRTSGREHYGYCRVTGPLVIQSTDARLNAAARRQRTLTRHHMHV